MSVKLGKIEELLPEYLSKKNYSKITILVDNHTKKYCYPKIKNLIDKHSLITIKNGEENKNLDICTNIWEQLTNEHFDRHALLINLGGGVIGDMGGFCAATYKRGIDFIQIPTTLLSQVDASVGGKLGVDFKGFKNHIGVFTQPQAVLIDASFLETLPERELRSGFAEVIKHTLIRDVSKWNELRKLDFDQMPFEELIRHSVDIKQRIVEEDPTEKGVRKILNFGHTIGHAIETFYLDKTRLLHGEAIAIGMICEAFISYKKGFLDETQLNEIEEFIFSIYGSVKINKDDFSPIISLTEQDKKNYANQVRASLLNGIGDCNFDITITKSEIQKSLNYYMGVF